MSEKKKLVVMMTRGMDDERSSVAWSVANGGLKADMDVAIFLTSSAVDWVRKGAMEVSRPNPLDPTIKDMMEAIVSNNCRIMVCPPCAKVRGYTEKDLIEGVEIVGSVAMHELIKQGAATLSF